MEPQVAILIDGDNISSKYAEYIRQEAMLYGNVKVFRLYGSVSSPSVKGWYSVMPQVGIMPVLQISYVKGKSIADQALTIDAMDLLHMDNLDVFCIVSSDSDFTKLVYRLKEAGKTVIGMGELKTNEALAKACNEFKILDLIYRDETENARWQETEHSLPQYEQDEIEPDAADAEEDPAEPEETSISIPEEGEIIAWIEDYLDGFDDKDKVNMAVVGRILGEHFLGFDARNYGYKNMTQFVSAHKDRFCVTRERTAGGGVVVFVKSK